MNILKFLLSNWDSILVVVAAAAGVIALIAQKQYAILDKIAFSLVTEAEKKYGGGTGAAKFAAVIEWLYPKIPALIRLFVTSKQLEGIIERVLSDAQKRWANSPYLAAYVRKEK
ncbi:hypothetical protein FACS1894208_07110 [Clostridia bacterium]|nr:hypothetical protein FACS1894208_07110 [Clostridia bacterium]